MIAPPTSTSNARKFIIIRLEVVSSSVCSLENFRMTAKGRKVPSTTMLKKNSCEVLKNGAMAC